MKHFRIMTICAAMGLGMISSLSAQLHPVDSIWVQKTLNSMTVEEKIGQLIMPAHQSLEKSKEYIQRFHAGSIWFAKSTQEKLIDELNKLQELAPYGLLVAADFEKGVGTHVDGGTDLPAAMALGASGDPQSAYDAAAITAAEARSLGIHWNFAPVVDINNNPKNPVINTRSYGSTPELVTVMAEATVRGYQENGLLATLKHFPGHGNTSVDTHTDMAAISGDRAELDRVELAPYRQLIGSVPPAAVMVSHLWLKAFDDTPIPATLSAHAVEGYLRTELHYDGIVCTDAMTMGAIRKHFSCGEATVRALQAGADVIVWPADVKEAYEAIRKAVADGTITMERLDRSVRRVLDAKTRVGLHQQKIGGASAREILGSADHQKRAKAIASKCLTLVRDTQQLLPLSPDRRYLVITFNNRSGGAMMSRTLVSFPGEFRKHAPAAEVIAMSDSMPEAEWNQALRQAREAEVVVVSAYVRIFLSSGTVELTERQRSFLQALSQANGKTIVISFGNPYIDQSIPEIPTFIAAYDNAAVLQEAVAEALFGEGRMKKR